MNILLTGGSSFTGLWFARQLVSRGHNVFATFQGDKDSYDGLRRRRIDELPQQVNRLWNSPTQSARLLGLIDEVGKWDLLCLHGAYLVGYRDPGFDACHALKNNTEGLAPLLEKLARSGMKRVVATGTVFEENEGAGEEPLRAFSPYGLSKNLTWLVQKYWVQSLGLHIGKFVIPNPFGPFEEPRFTSYLVKSWLAGKVPEVRTPLYIRDNIHVSCLARHYSNFAEGLGGEPGTSRCAPMGYVESQGAFTLRFAQEMRSRLGLECRFELAEQKTFDEPRMRVNTQALSLPVEQWQEPEAWDDLATYYRLEFASQKV